MTLHGVILSGGAGQRLGGIDKGWIEIGGRSLIERACTFLAPQVDQLSISASRHLDRYAALGWQVVADDHAAGPHPGPLVAMAGVSAVLPAGDLLFLPVDALAPPSDLVQRLRVALTPLQPAMVTMGSQVIPVCCLIPQSLRASLVAAVAAGACSPRHWLQACGVSEVSFSSGVWSLNTAEELARAGAQAVDGAAFAARF